MNNNGFSVSYNYYDKNSSYLKMIVEMLPEERLSFEKREIIKELYNYYMNKEFSEEKRNQIINVSRMFIDLVTNSNVETLPIDANYICTMLDNFIFDSEGRLETLNSLNGFIKAYVGYNNACNIIKQHNITMAELDASYIM